MPAQTQDCPPRGHRERIARRMRYVSPIAGFERQCKRFASGAKIGAKAGDGEEETNEKAQRLLQYETRENVSSILAAEAWPYSGIFPCFLVGMVSTLCSSMRSA